MVTLVFTFSWNMEAFSVVNWKPSGQLHLLHCPMAHSLYWRKDRKRWGVVAVPAYPDGTQNTSSHGSVFSDGFFFPQHFMRVPMIWSTYSSILLCFLCSHCTEEKAPAGPDLDIRLIEMSRTLLQPWANLWKHFALPNFKQLKKKGMNDRKGVGCVLMNNKTAFLLFPVKFFPMTVGRRVVKLWAMFVQRITAALLVFDSFFQVAVGLKLLK